ncbi:hypothetical protein ACEPAG_8932 [Sanghuangporus baumii]
MFFCPYASSNPFDLEDACIRTTWSAFVPFALVALYLLRLLSIRAFSRFISFSSPLIEFLSLEDAEALDYDESKPKGAAENEQIRKRSPFWFTITLTVFGLIETGSWLAVGAYMFAVGDKDIRGGILAFLFAATWLYASLKPALKPSVGPPYDLFALYLVHLVGASLMLEGVVFDHDVYDDPMPRRSVLLGLIANLVVTTGLVALVLSRPLNDPNILKESVGKNVSPEDFTTLWGWVSFSWVNPLVKKGTNETLKEEDVWDLSITMQARPVFRKFSTLDQKRSLLWKIWAANSRDIVLDFVGTFASVFCNYLGPYFLKRIIDAIDTGLPSTISRAYLFAVLMFASQVLKAQADLQHLWYNRRAGVRIRSQLMSAIYDKALKRKDLSGIVNKQEKEKKDGDEKRDGKKGKKKEDKSDEPKAGADIGKIVNLMAGDSQRIAMTVGSMYFIYGAPLEIFIASVFLYQLLGLSAFSGFAALLLVWPFNNFLARRAIRIQKGVLTARDKRMGVVNELLGALKFIKFFAWEDRWISRTEESRAEELKWLVKSRFNSVMFQAVWSTAPILVSVISFLTYVSRGHELTVGTAFTAIALFSMIRQPLNGIPTWIVQVLQTRVTLQRLETFLGEDEVGPQVSTLKEDVKKEFSDVMVLGLENASLKWNAVEEKEKSDDNKSKGKDNRVKRKGSVQRDIEAAITETLQSDISRAGTETVDQDHMFELRDISVVFPDGALSVVTGPTASGKTALLLALLGEMTLIDGKILMHKDIHHVYENGLTHSISYAAQTPWLQHQSIKENILFGAPLERERYDAVLDACALRPDLAIFEDGDETEIGARGVSLSGGQKARVALARAVYARTKYVLLDDPLSAVDSHTARHLFQKLLMGPLLKDRTIILVTHHVELVLPGTYYLVRMLDGRIDVQGTVKELRENGTLDAITLEETIEENREDEQKADEGEDQAMSEMVQEEATDEDDAGGSVTAKKSKKPRKLVKDEERETGSVKWRIYKTYLKASSYWTWAILLILILCVQCLGFIEKYWIKVWGEAYGKGASIFFNHLFSSNAVMEQQNVLPHSFLAHHYPNMHQIFDTMGLEDHLPPAHEKPLFYVAVYALIGLATVVVSVTSSATQYTGALYASRTLFSRLLRTVVRATMRWMDTTPTGRILNRFSKDIETVDSNLASSLQAVNQSLASFFTSLVVIVVVFPPFVFPAIFIGYFYYKLAIGYLNTGRDLRRMESTSRSPIFSGFAELLEGIVTVRAFSAEPRFMNGLYHKIDLTLQMFNHFWMTNRWLLLRFDFLSAFAVFCTTMFALSSNQVNRPGWAGWAGLCITSAMQFTNNMYWTCRFWTQLELDLNSVERIVEYLDLPQEPPVVIENSRPPAHWPSSSGPNEDKLVEVKDLVVRYAPDLPAVLHRVSFTLRARERVGLLGRTGSGKSTLAMSLLRFTDPAEGQINIDGIDITTIGVNDLRSRLTFIPQDATLFSGTIRDNLDPFDDYSDLECLDALRRVQMISDSTLVSRRSSRAPSIRNVEREETDSTAVDSPAASGSGTGSPSRAPSESTAVAGENGIPSEQTKISLNTEVSSGGLNFSAGQRQLIAMARALLRRSAVVILDEATSSIDFATDAKIQRTIREEFSDSLLLTIAHRLRTVIDYDRLLVLDAGEIVEFDTPYNLLRKEGGIFRGMCMKSGNYAELEHAAKAKVESSP